MEIREYRYGYIQFTEILSNMYPSLYTNHQQWPPKVTLWLNMAGQLFSFANYEEESGGQVVGGLSSVVEKARNIGLVGPANSRQIAVLRHYQRVF